LGILAPTAWNLAGSDKNSLISWSSSTASSTPATSVNVTCGDSLLTIRARDLPKFIIRLLPPCIRDMRNQNRPTISRIENRVMNSVDHQGVWGTTAL